MRYQLFVKLNKPDLDPPDQVFAKNNSDLVSETKNIILVENPEKRKSTERLPENEKEAFRYEIPQVRASLTLKVSPSNNSIDSNQQKKFVTMCNPNNIPSCQPENDTKTSIIDNKSMPSNSPLPECKKKSCNNYKKMVLKSVPANKSTYNGQAEDKDFEIPLEESLQAVEEFIKREQELAKWHIGEIVLAKWKGNGLYYKAKITEILISGLVTVLFDSYDVIEEIDYRDLCKYFRKTSNFKKKGLPSKDKVQLELPTFNGNHEKKFRRRNKRSLGQFCFVSFYKKANKCGKKRLVASHRKVKALKIIRNKITTWHI
ncbi:uncharacterized protein LOC115882554 [Sitophilus oryzae]|uniref:Uncharacterized protein LOC115882554 n=1 Tax=Sitophilus oryzae TaxID=7048 RepID=A0A6J2Y0W6_SITOR|nr:uncharacterized protein LOC115882554 [Sitophilus oryzae]